MTVPRAKRVIRKFRLPDYLGVEETAINQLEDLGLLRFFSMTVGGRAQVVTEENVAELQEEAMKSRRANRSSETRTRRRISPRS